MTLAAVALLLLHLPGTQTQSPLDTLVEVGGYRMHLVVHRGTRPLTIVLESGGGASLDAWSGLDARLAARTEATVVAFDRAGFGRSDTGPPDLTPRRQVEQLGLVLERLGTPPDRIVVGTSYGGLMAVLHAHLDPINVRGLVLVDPMNPRFVRATGDFVYSTVPRLEPPLSGRDTALVRLAGTFDPLVGDPTASDVGLATPMVIVTAGDAWWGRDDIDRAWRASHEAMAEAGPRRRLVVAHHSGHDIPAKRPDTIIDAALALMVMMPADQDMLNVTDHPAEDRDPAWLPDGRSLLFSSDRSGDFDIYRISLGGGPPVRIVAEPGPDRFPAPSPTGDRIAYGGTRGGVSGLWVTDREGGSPTLLVEDESRELTPAWSPDGRRIAFTSERSGNFDLWAISVDRRDLVQLTRHPARDVWPRWSPDGTRVLFFSRRDTDDTWDDLYLLTLEDGTIRRLTDNGPMHDFTPSWSSDGRRIAAAQSDGRTDRAIAIYDLEGQLIHRLADRYARVFQPTWSPDGASLAVSVRETEGAGADILLLRVPREPGR